MSFTTNKYTRPVLMKNVRSLNAGAFTNLNSFAMALSPRAGRKSAQFSALNSAVSSLTSLLNSTTLSNRQKRSIIVASINS